MGRRSSIQYRAIERGAVEVVPFSPGTGHVPVGHNLLLYMLAEVEPILAAAEFSEVARFDPGDAEENAPSPYTLQAWCGSRA